MTWQGIDSRIDSIDKIPFLFSNQRNNFYSIITAPDNFDREVTLSMNCCDGRKKIISHKIKNLKNKIPAGSIYALAGRDVIEHLESMEMDLNPNVLEQYRKNIIDISLSSKVLSKYTAFIGVEKRNTASEETMELRTIPIQLTSTQCIIKPCLQDLSSTGGFHSSGDGANYSDLTTACENEILKCDTLECASESNQPKLRDQLVQILNLQQWAGDWTLSDELVKVLETDATGLLVQIKSRFGKSSTSNGYITAYVLIMLCEKFFARKVMWKLLFEKGIDYLLDNGELDMSVITSIRNMNV